MRLTKIGFVIALFALVLLISVIPAFAEPVAIINSASYEESTCILTVSWTVEDAGSYFLQIWDDGELVFENITNYAAGQVISTQIKVGAYKTFNPGIGILVGPIDGDYTDYIDPFEYPNTNCATGTYSIVTANAACPIALPSGSVVYSVPLGAPTYYAASLDTLTTFSLPAGTWYVSEFSGDFAKVWIACQANMVWIPTSAVSR